MACGFNVGPAFFYPLHKHHDVASTFAFIAWPKQHIGRLEFVTRSETGADARVEIIAANPIRQRQQNRASASSHERYMKQDSAM